MHPGNYHAEDNTLVTVSKPFENSITGGGHLINEYSDGVFAGETGLKTNFVFDIKFSKQPVQITPGHSLYLTVNVKAGCRFT